MARRLIIGPPGTGKTSTGLDLVEQAISSGIHPSRVLYASFTRAASYGARDRALSRFSEYTSDDFPYFRTLHSIAFRLLRLNQYAMFDGKRLKEFAKIFNYKFSNGALEKDIFRQDIIDMALGTDAEGYLAFDEWRKNRLILDVDEAYHQYTQKQIELPRDFNKKSLKLFLERKEEYKQKEGLWEFSDLLLKVYQERIPLGVDFVVIDEAQDCSPLLHEVAEIFAQGAKDIYLIGDPDQALYSFMGAEPSLMLDWKRDEDIVLKQSHRCSQAVHDLSRKIVERMKVRYHSDFFPTEVEGRVLKMPVAKVDFDSGGTTFLAARTRYLLDKHYDELLRLGIPFKTKRGRDSPLDKASREVVLTLLRLMDDSRVTLTDVYKLARALPQRPWLNRGAKTTIRERAKEEPNHRVSRISLPALGFTTDFMAMLNDREYLEALKISPEEKRYFRKLISQYGRQALTEEPSLVLGTYHSFKGLECDKMVLDLELTRLPYENLMQNADEEHRVFYVGATRSREEIDLLTPDTWRNYPL